jgi:hypothetical protein
MPLRRSRPRRLVARATDFDAVTELLLERADLLMSTTTPTTAPESLKLGRFGSRQTLATVESALRRHYTHNVPPYLHEMTNGAVLRGELGDDPLFAASALADAAIAAETAIALQRREVDVAHGIGDDALLRNAHLDGQAKLFRDMFRLRLMQFNAVAEGRVARPGIEAPGGDLGLRSLIVPDGDRFVPWVANLGEAMMAAASVAAAPAIVRTPGVRVQLWGGGQVLEIASYDTSDDTVMSKIAPTNGARPFSEYPLVKRTIDQVLACCKLPTVTGIEVPASALPAAALPGPQLPKATPPQLGGTGL